MPKVLVTGGCGYIGSHTLVELIAAGHEPISIDDNSRSSETILDGVERITGRRVRNYQVDLRNAPLTETVFAENRDAIAVIHFAAFKTVPESVAEPLLYYDNNINSLLSVFACTDKYRIPSFIFSSSCAVYGNAKQLLEVYNLGSGVGTTVLEAVGAFERVTGRKLNYRIGPRRAGDAAAVYADNRKAEAVLGWRPELGIDEMMKTAWLWEQNRQGRG